MKFLRSWTSPNCPKQLQMSPNSLWMRNRYVSQSLLSSEKLRKSTLTVGLSWVLSSTFLIRRSPWLLACLYARLWAQHGQLPKQAFATRPNSNWQHCIVTNLHRQLNNEQSSQIHDDCSIGTYLMYQKSMVIIDWRENQNSGGSLWSHSEKSSVCLICLTLLMLGI